MAFDQTPFVLLFTACKFTYGSQTPVPMAFGEKVPWAFLRWSWRPLFLFILSHIQFNEMNSICDPKKTHRAENILMNAVQQNFIKLYQLNLF